MWATYVANFVFWVGIAHCGTLVSAILFLFRSHFRRAVYRVAEAMTVFGVMTAGLFPILHLGRPWFPYWLFPYPKPAPAVAQLPLAAGMGRVRVTTYLTVSSVFFIVGIIPDAAAQRDGAKNRFHRLVGVGSSRSAGAGPTTSGSTTTVLISTSPPSRPRWCCRCTASCPGTSPWPRCRAGTAPSSRLLRGRAIFSGVALVINLLIIIRKGFRLEHIVTTDHVEKLAKLVLLTSTIVGYSYLCEFFCAWYGPSKFEREMFWWRFTGHFWWASGPCSPATCSSRCCCGPRRSAAARRRCSHHAVRERRDVVRALRHHHHVARRIRSTRATGA